MKKLIALLLALIMVLGLVACGNTNQPVADDPVSDEPTSAPAPAPVDPEAEVAWDTSKEDEIIVSVINGYYTAGEKKLAEEYMKLHPETKVTIDVIADNDSYFTKMQTILSGDGSATPDIVHANFLTTVVGSPDATFKQGYLIDMSTILDLDHPYQEGIVRDMYTEDAIKEVVNGSGGNAMDALPFDKCGVSFYYNKTVFAELGLSAPESWEDLLEVCATLEENGYKNPVTVSNEASWILASLADAGFRYQEADFLVQPGDAIWNEETMADNVDFVFDDNNMACDAFTVESKERQYMARKDGIIFSDISKTAWTEFANLAKYFPENFIEGGTDSVTEFEMQISPMLITGSWNVGLILADMNMMPEDAQFDWATFNIPGFENPPEGFGTEMRGLYVRGNNMGIVPSGDADHDARVLDFYLFWYSQAGAQMCYEETLASGNFVQGPCSIAGVELSPELSEKLAGFIVEGPVKQYSSELIGMSQTSEADRPVHNDLLNKFVAGEISLDEFLEGMNKVMDAFADSQIEASGYDLDPAT